MIRKFILLICTASLLAGCLTRKPDVTRHYILEYPPVVQDRLTGNGKTLDKSCQITPVSVFPAFATQQIALREDTHEIRYFVLNIWAVRPEQSLTNILTEYLISHRVFTSVHWPALMHQTDYTINTKVFSLEVIKERRDYYAHLSVEYGLTDNESSRVIHRHRADRKVPLGERNLNLFASAISEIFIEELETFTQSILTGLD